MQKVWNIKKYDEEYIKKIEQEYGISRLMAKLLVSRNILSDEIDMFLNGDVSSLKDPYKMKDMEKLVKRVKEAIKNKEKICIYGDYDVDGITSITIFHRFLSELGADVTYYLPDRLLEGYGINKKALLKIKEAGTSLVITVDCGITAVEEVEYAKEIGLDIIITDHHECDENVPDTIAVVNPKQSDDKYSFDMLAGVGVAFKCITALSKSYELDESSYMKYLDIVAIGTISDIVPLIDENRIISKYGLNSIIKTENLGIKSMLKVINFKEVDSTMISFGMAPRINACGRMGNASIAVELFLSEDEEKAYELALELDRLNSVRQNVEKEIFESALQRIKEGNHENKSSIVLYDEKWHNGVIGIVASRLVNIYHKPVILFTKENGIVRGSGRCQSKFSIYDALSKCSEYLVQFGGHELAAGMSIEEDKIPVFAEEFEKVVYEAIKDKNEQIIDIDMEITKKDLNINILKDIRELKPYGQCNSVPLFAYKNLKINSIRTLKEDKHLKFTLKDDKILIEALAFYQGNRRDEFRLGDKIDVVCNVELNTYNTPKTIQLILQDFKKHVDA